MPETSEAALLEAANRAKQRYDWVSEAKLWRDLATKVSAHQKKYINFAKQAEFCAKYKNDFERRYQTTARDIVSELSISDRYESTSTQVIGTGSVSCVVYGHRLRNNDTGREVAIAEKVFPRYRHENALREQFIYRTYSGRLSELPTYWAFCDAGPFLSLYTEWVDGEILTAEQWKARKKRVVASLWGADIGESGIETSLIGGPRRLKRLTRTLRRLERNKLEDRPRKKIVSKAKRIIEEARAVQDYSPTGIMHGDLCRQNVLWAAADSWTVIDWDKCSLEPLGVEYPIEFASKARLFREIEQSLQAAGKLGLVKDWSRVRQIGLIAIADALGGAIRRNHWQRAEEVISLYDEKSR